eukprot:253380-Prymnesium_polylepis.2
MRYHSILAAVALGVARSAPVSGADGSAQADAAKRAQDTGPFPTVMHSLSALEPFLNDPLTLTRITLALREHLPDSYVKHLKSPPYDPGFEGMNWEGNVNKRLDEVKTVTLNSANLTGLNFATLTAIHSVEIGNTPFFDKTYQQELRMRAQFMASPQATMTGTLSAWRLFPLPSTGIESGKWEIPIDSTEFEATLRFTLT